MTFLARRAGRRPALKVAPSLPDTDIVRSPLLESLGNGGFPEPPASADIRVVCARHDACGTQTRVRLPSEVPARAVRRLRCSGCEQAFEAARVHELGVLESAARPSAAARAPIPAREPLAAPVAVVPLAAPEPAVAAPAPAPSPPSWPKLSLPKLDPSSRFWRLASIPLAAALVIAGLLALQGGGDEPAVALPTAPAASAEAPAVGAGNGEDEAAAKGAGSDSKSSKADKLSKDAKLVTGTGYSLALPAGWEQVEPQGGATFAAESADGDADATLWIRNDPKLDFPSFISQSMAQLEALAGSADIVERVPAPTPEATVVRLAADAPPGQPTYEVTLRVAGPLRYYLATSVDPGASAIATEGVKTINTSFTPDVNG